jgi:hypothetical protein
MQLNELAVEEPLVLTRHCVWHAATIFLEVLTLNCTKHTAISLSIARI